MPFYDHLKGQNPETKYLTRAYGRHIFTGHLVKSRVTGSSPSHVIDIQQALGLGPWDSIENVYFRGLRLAPTSYKFRPGIRPSSRTDTVQGVSTIFTTDVPHNGAATLEATLPSGVGDADAKASPPLGLTAIAKTGKVLDYDDAGNDLGAATYSPNPARVVADLCLQAGIPISTWFDWEAWAAWRDHCDTLLLCDYTTLPDPRGFGLTAEFYTGTSFGALVETRIEPFISFATSSGGPSVAAGVDNFSAKFRGKIRARYSGTHTFYLAHDAGARLYVGDLSTPLIDEWTVNGSGATGTTINLTAGQFYDIEVHWFDDVGDASIRLEWSHASITKEVVPDNVLYPKPAYKPRYEAHIFWSSPTRLDDAILQVLALCNSTYQEADGKLKFFAYDQLTAPSFTFTVDNVKDGSGKYTPRDPTVLRNFYTSKFRDLESQYLEEPLVPITYELPDLVALADRRIEGDTIEFFNSTRWQVYRVLKAAADRTSKSKFTLELTGLPDTYPVLAGDRVAVTLPDLNMTAVDCLVVASYDSSPEQTADERRFILKEWI